MYRSMLLVENTNYIHRSLSLVENEICDGEKFFFFGIIVKLKKRENCELMIQ